MKKPLVSFIVPVYNGEEYLTACVNSILSQTFSQIELLLIDDGSTDKSGELCDDLAANDSRVRVFHKENGGTHTARNLGVEHANGEYLMFCDPDDWYDVDTVEQLAAHLTTENLDVLRFSYVREFRGTSLKKQNTFLQERLYTDMECEVLRRQTVGLIGTELSHPENFNFLASVCFSAYKADIIKANQITFDNIREIGTFSDGLFNIKFLKYAERFRFVDKAFYHYRKTNAASATSNYRKDFLDKQLLLFDKIEHYIADQDSSEYRQAFGNRLSYSVMELCNNALKNQSSVSVKYKEIRKILKTPQLRDAYKYFNTRFLPPIWKLYYGFIKLKSALIVYSMTSALLFIQKRGK